MGISNPYVYIYISNLLFWTRCLLYVEDYIDIAANFNLFLLLLKPTMLAINSKKWDGRS